MQEEALREKEREIASTCTFRPEVHASPRNLPKVTEPAVTELQSVEPQTFTDDHIPGLAAYLKVCAMCVCVC